MTCLKLMLEEIMVKDMAAALSHKPSRATAQEKVIGALFSVLLKHTFFLVYLNLIKYKSCQAFLHFPHDAAIWGIEIQWQLT